MEEDTDTDEALTGVVDDICGNASNPNAFELEEDDDEEEDDEEEDDEEEKVSLPTDADV